VFDVEGKYYDPDTDMYLTYDQWKAFDPELPIKESEQSDVKVILDKHNITSVDDIEYGSKAYEELFSYYMDSGEMPYGTMKARDGDPDQWIADRVSDLGLIREDAGDDGYSWNCKKCGTANEFRMTPQEQQEYIDDWEKDNQDLVADGETGESALDWVLTTIGQESEMHIGSKCKKCGTVAVDTVVGEKADNSTDLMKQYKDNEHNNYHSENNLLLAKAFGTPKEVKMVELVLAKNKKQGYTDTMDSEWMYHNIHKKYYPELVKGKLKEVYGSIGEGESDQGFSGKERNFIHDLCMMHDGVKRDPAGLKYLGTSETWDEGNCLSDKGKLTTLMLWANKNKDAVEKRFSRMFNNYSNKDEKGKVTASDGNQMLNDITSKIGGIGEQTVKGPRGHLRSIVADDLNEIDCWDGYKKDGTKPGTGKNKGKRVNNCVKEEDVTVDNAGNIAGYLATIDEYVEMLADANSHYDRDEAMDSHTVKEIAYRIQNAVDDIRMRELGLKPSNIRSKFNEDEVNEEHDIGLLKAVARQMEADAHKGDYTAIEELLQNISTEELKAFLSDHRDIDFSEEELNELGFSAPVGAAGKTSGYAPPSTHTISSRSSLSAKQKRDGSQSEIFTQYADNFQHDGADRGRSTMSDVSIQKYDADGKMTKNDSYNRFVMPGGAGIDTTNGVTKNIQMKGPQSWAYDKPKLPRIKREGKYVSDAQRKAVHASKAEKK
jgi:hypothetical protein